MPRKPGGSAFRTAAKFAKSEKFWLDWFTFAWKIATSNSYKGELQYLDDTKRKKESLNSKWETAEDVGGCSEYTTRNSCKKRSQCKWVKKKGSKLAQVE